MITIPTKDISIKKTIKSRKVKVLFMVNLISEELYNSLSKSLQATKVKVCLVKNQFLKTVRYCLKTYLTKLTKFVPPSEVLKFYRLFFNPENMSRKLLGAGNY